MSAPPPERRPRIVLAMRLAVIMVTAVIVVALGAALQVSQTNSQRQLTARFEARGQLASSFAATWVAQLLDQQGSVAVDSLSGTTQLDKSLAIAADVFDFRAAMIVDSHGRSMASYPRTPGLIGTDMASRQPYLRAVLNGHSAVSSAIVSASRGVPVVEFAVPYYTPNGRRVFTGAYELNRMPLGAFLQTVTPIVGSHVFLVEAAETVVSTSAVPDNSEGSLAMTASLATAYRLSPKGRYASRAGSTRFFTSEPVAGTPWSLVLDAPQDGIFAPLHGPQHSVPWLVLGLVALLAGGANWMMIRLLRGRDRLRVVNAALDSSARTDQLTNLPNRRHLDESLAAVLSAGGRHKLPVSVLVMDVDHFKQVNDTYGHTVGDRVLEHIAEVLSEAVRTEDIVGRWGGEEFLAVLPHTDAAGAALIAERLRQVMHDSLYANNAGDQSIRTTLSIGYATDLLGGDKDGLIHRADQALYRAKAAGRNTVCGEATDRAAAAPQPPPSDLVAEVAAGVVRD